MSKKSPTFVSLGARIQPYEIYLSTLARKLEADVTCELDGKGGLEVIFGSFENIFVLVMVLTKDDSCWVIKDFKAPIGHKILSGYYLLAFYGKRCAQYENDYIRPSKEIWTITCPRDLQALLTAYDNLARELGLRIIFGH